MAAASWSDLLPDLLDRIVDCIDTDIDLLRFRSICSSWRTSAVRQAPHRLTSPLQILPTAGLQILDSTSSECHLSESTFNLVGGWLTRVKDGNRLLHPLQTCSYGRPENHPGIFDVREFRVREFHRMHVLRDPESPPEKYMKAAMVSSGGEFVVLTTRDGGRLVKFESWIGKWTEIEHRIGCPYQDVIVHNGDLLAVDCLGEVVMVGKHGEDPVTVAAAGDDTEFHGDKKYLVSSKDGELLLVDEGFGHMFRGVVPGVRKHRVYMLYKDKTWLEVESLGDNVVFFGGESFAFMVPSCELDGVDVRNCIFYPDYDSDMWPPRGRGTMDVHYGLSLFDLGIGRDAPLENFPEYFKLFWPPPTSNMAA